MIGHQISDKLHSVGKATLGAASQHFEQTRVVSVQIFVVFGRGGHFYDQEREGMLGARKSGYEPKVEMFALNTINWSTRTG
jgi:hypothetical protein